MILLKRISVVAVAASLVFAAADSHAKRPTVANLFIRAALRVNKRSPHRLVSPKAVLGPVRTLSNVSTAGTTSRGEPFQATFSVVTLGRQVVTVTPTEQSQPVLAAGLGSGGRQVKASRGAKKLGPKVVRRVAELAEELFGARDISVSLRGPVDSSRDVVVSGREPDGQPRTHTYRVGLQGAKVASVNLIDSSILR